MTSVVVLTDDQVAQMLIPELKAELRDRKLRISGRKRELVSRLKAALALEREHGAREDDVEDEDPENEDETEDEAQDEDDDGSEDDVNNGREVRSPIIQRPSKRSERVLLTFRDVEETMEKFSADKNECVNQWFEEFEENAELCQWSEAQKVTYAKRLLTGSAKLFVKYEKCGKSYVKLKKSLKKEFAEAVDVHQVHRQLSERKKKADETYQEYIYKMLDIAAAAEVGPRAVIQYIIEGIPDDVSNKAILYGSRTIRQLKEKMNDYEKMKREMKLKSKVSERKPEAKIPLRTQQKVCEKKVKRCYNCGEVTHLSVNCPARDKGAKCFRCSAYGHIAAKCPSSPPKEANAVSQPSLRKHVKDILIMDHKFTALVDTGSDLTLIREDEYTKIGLPKLNKNSVKFDGIGSYGNETIGEFMANVIIDGEVYHINFHVVPSAMLRYSVLLGTDFLNRIDLIIREGRVTIKKMLQDPSNQWDVPEIYQINITDENRELDLTHIGNKSYRTEIKKIIESYQPVKTMDIGIKTKIILKDEIPVAVRPRRLALAERKEVEEIMKAWLNEGIIRHSNSEYASPIVLVRKKNGSTRVCIDYRDLNKKIVRLRYPLPLIEDQLDTLQDARVFTTIDLKNGFFHVPVEEESRKYTAFVTPCGQYEFNKTPFGLCLSPCIFQKYINAIFRDLSTRGVVVVYMDDVIIRAIDLEEAMRHLKETLEVAKQHGLNINWEKCRFLQREIEYLGYIVKEGLVRPSDHKTEAVKHFPNPSSVKHVQSFLGLTGYFRKFIPQYALIARPLTTLLKKDVAFQFGERELESFMILKTALINKPVLNLYRSQAETELHTDASQLGYGAVLMQMSTGDNKFHPIYYASSKTTPAEEKYCSYELEVLAVIKALRKFRVYLLGISFKIITDCRAFAMTMKKRDLCVRVARWALLLEEFDYEVCHRSGKNMQHVDALSRNPMPKIMLVSESEHGLIAKLRSAQGQDEALQKLIVAAARNQADDYCMENGLLYKKVEDDLLLVVPRSMQAQIVRQAHERGHFGITKTEAIVKREYWFKNMRERVEQIIGNCVSCILAERKHGKQEGYLHPIHKGETPLSTYHIDHVGPMTVTKKKYQYVLVVVDAFSKFVWLYPTKSTDSADVINRLQKQAVIFGNPQRIVSDRGTAFTSQAFQTYCNDERIMHSLITTGIPRGNGQVERVNRTMIPLLTKLAAPTTENWFKHVDTVQRYLNATPQRSTGQTPFRLLLGVEMRIKEDLHIKELIDHEYFTIFDDERKELRELAKEKIHQTQQENRKGYDKRRKKAKKYRIGDLVAIKRTQFGPGLKLRGKFLGPYKVIRVMRNDRYMVEKIDEHEGPNSTSTAADFMKPWTVKTIDDETSDDDDDEDI